MVFGDVFDCGFIIIIIAHYCRLDLWGVYSLLWLLIMCKHDVVHKTGSI